MKEGIIELIEEVTDRIEYHLHVGCGVKVSEIKKGIESVGVYEHLEFKYFSEDEVGCCMNWGERLHNSILSFFQLENIKEILIDNNVIKIVFFNGHAIIQLV